MSISDDDLARLLDSEEPGPSAKPIPHDQTTDLTNAEALVARHGAHLRYCHPWQAWLCWDGTRWQADAAGQAEQLAKQTVRALLADALEIDDEKRRVRTIRDLAAAEREGRIRGMLTLARSEHGIPIAPQALDADPWLFNTANALIDLRTGQARQPRPNDLITRQAPVNHDPDAQAPLWDAFLERVLPDLELRQFLQRAAGYSLAGGNPAQVLLILYGSGANGKSTFLELIRHLLGDYGQQAPPETFLAKHEGIPNDVARLRGARFVAATEIAEGRRLNEPLIKRMTGGDTMTARYLRQEYFEFEPRFTPWLATNHKPEIRGTDEAIWRRIRLIPFLERIPPQERDENLQAKLRQELPGILNWLLAGCRAWQEDGLAEPQAVRAATNDYREEQDLLGGFLSEETIADTDATTTSAALYDAYQQWAHANGIEILSSRRFGRKLGERDLQSIKMNQGRAWQGLRLRSGQQPLE